MLCGRADQERERLGASRPKWASPAQRLLKAKIVEGRCLKRCRPAATARSSRRSDTSVSEWFTGCAATGEPPGGVEPQATGHWRLRGFLTAREGSQTHCAPLVELAQGARKLDAAAVGKGCSSRSSIGAMRAMNDRRTQNTSSPIADSAGSFRQGHSAFVSRHGGRAGRLHAAARS